SLALEETIRAYTGSHARANLSNITPQAGNIIMNTPSLDKWAEQLSMVTYRPMIKEALKGTEPTLLSVTKEGEGQGSMLELTGTVPLNKK
ncbi:MAG: hypothetical protein GWN00_38090, partial [Aliifodinibius sp.]|nr:hypothetical protein [Fodinibius sp.]NIV12950.1 hypothetical protein [Fodinibius sp.]NIY30389.1 hypothetical protein [Fodinibius sp.]